MARLPSIQLALAGTPVGSPRRSSSTSSGWLALKWRSTWRSRPTSPTVPPENVVRTVTENCRALKLETDGFEDA